VLVGFLEAAHARTVAEITGDERRKLITSTLVNYFGTQAAEQFDIVKEGLNGRGVHPVLLWGHVGAGVWTRYGKARRAGRPIDWAGSEGCDVWDGYIAPSALGAAPPPRSSPTPTEHNGRGPAHHRVGGCPLDQNNTTNHRMGTVMVPYTDTGPHTSWPAA
jgi:hypothetical protein